MPKNKLILRLTESIKDAINEELGIADEVTAALYTIQEKLKEDYKQSFSVSTGIDGITRRFGGFDVNVFGEELKVSWNCYNYQNFELLQQHPMNTLGQYIKKTYDSPPELRIIILSLQGNINYSITYDILRHELHHFYEDVKRGFKPLRKRELYKYARQLHKYPKNDIRNMVGSIIYMSFKHEQTAFYNGAYEYLMTNTDVACNFRMKIQDTPMFGNLQHLYKCIDALESIGEENWKNGYHTREMADKLKYYYNITYNKLLKIGRRAVKEIVAKLGRAVIKAQDDYEGEQYITF